MDVLKRKKGHHVEDHEVQGVTAEETLRDSIVLYPKIILYCIGLSFSFLLTGYDTVITGTVTAVPPFQQDFGEHYRNRYIIPSVWMSLWSALGYVGSIIGAAAAGPWQDRSGRRWPLAWGSVISAVAVAILYVSNLPVDIDTRRGLFLFGKIVQGFAIGVVTAATQTYISENVPTSLRGPTMGLFPTFTLLGQLVGAVEIYVSLAEPSSRSYLMSFVSQWPFSAVPFVMALVVPESPAYLVRRDRAAAALRAERRLHLDKVDVADIVEHLQQSIQLEREWAQEVRYQDCFRGANARRSLIAILAMMIPVFFGLPLLSNASYYLQVVGMSPQYSLVFLVLGIGLGLVSNGIGVWIASRVGRRPLTLISLSSTTVLWLSMGIAGCWDGAATIWYLPPFPLKFECKKKKKKEKKRKEKKRKEKPQLRNEQVHRNHPNGNHHHLQPGRMASLVRHSRRDVLSASARQNPSPGHPVLQRGQHHLQPDPAVHLQPGLGRPARQNGVCVCRVLSACFRGHLAVGAGDEGEKRWRDRCHV